MAYHSQRHPYLVEHAPFGGYCPGAVGIVPRYPRTKEAYDQMCQRLAKTREQARRNRTLMPTNVPNGWAGQKAALAELRDIVSCHARANAARIPGWDEWCWEAQAALIVCWELALDPTVHPVDRIAAVNVVLTYLQPKPTLLREETQTAETVLAKLVPDGVAEIVERVRQQQAAKVRKRGYQGAKLPRAVPRAVV